MRSRLLPICFPCRFLGSANAFKLCGNNGLAFRMLYQLEMSCRSQVDAMAARAELTMPGENVLAHTAHLYQPGTRRPYGVLEWPATPQRVWQAIQEAHALR